MGFVDCLVFRATTFEGPEEFASQSLYTPKIKLKAISCLSLFYTYL